MQNENDLKEADRALRAADKQRIAYEMQAIVCVGCRVTPFDITVSKATLICNRTTLCGSIEMWFNQSSMIENSNGAVASLS